MAIGTRANPPWAPPPAIASKTFPFSPWQWAAKPPAGSGLGKCFRAGLRAFGRGHRHSLQSHQPFAARSQNHRFASSTHLAKPPKRRSPSRPTAKWKTPFSGPRAPSAKSPPLSNCRSNRTKPSPDNNEALLSHFHPRGKTQSAGGGFPAPLGISLLAQRAGPRSRRGHALPAAASRSSGRATAPITSASFPRTKEALSPYDVVFLGDVGIGQDELTEKDAELLKGLVEQQASGLVFVPGRRGREATFLDSPLKDLVSRRPGRHQAGGHRTAKRVVNWS